jgi:hypothetical protein
MYRLQPAVIEYIIIGASSKGFLNKTTSHTTEKGIHHLLSTKNDNNQSYHILLNLTAPATPSYTYYGK